MVCRNTTIGLLAVVATVMTTVSVTPQSHVWAIAHVSVVDVVDGRILPNSTVTISGRLWVESTQLDLVPEQLRSGNRH